MAFQNRDERPDSALLFSPRNRSDRSPNFAGEIIVSDELLKKLIADRKAGGQEGSARLRIAIWRKDGPKAGTYLSMSIRSTSDDDQYNSDSRPRAAAAPRREPDPFGL